MLMTGKLSVVPALGLPITVYIYAERCLLIASKGKAWTFDLRQMHHSDHEVRSF